MDATLDKTLVNDNFIKNSQSYQDQLPIETNASGNWSGSLTENPESSESGFSGSGDYILKVGRYTLDGSGSTWSNELIININQALTSTPVSTSHSTPTNLPTSQVLSASTKEATAPQISQSLIPLSLLATTQANLNQKDQDNPLSKTDESNLQVLPFKLNLGIIPGILITLIGIALAGVYFLKKRTT